MNSSNITFIAFLIFMGAMLYVGGSILGLGIVSIFYFVAICAGTLYGKRVLLG